MKKLFVSCFALVLPLTGVVHASVSIKAKLAFEGTNQVNLAWIATPGSVYALSTTTNLSQPWQPVSGQPPTFTATNNSLAVNLPIDTVARFFQVARLDTQGPQIYRTSPLNNAIAVSQQAVLQAWLQDETGVNTNSIVFAIGTNPPVTLHDPRLVWSTNGVLTYTPGTNEVLGALGQTVTVSLSAADTLGNLTTNFTWSFQLALPTILSSNIVFLGVGTNPPASLILLSTNENTFTYSYTGNSSGLTNGMQLVNSDPATGYTVTVVNFTEQPTNNTVVVVTRPTLLAELLQQGNLTTSGFTEVTNDPSKQSLTQLGLPLNYSYPLNAILYQDGNLQIETTPGSAVSLNADLNIAANFSGFTLTAFQVTVEGSANLQLDFQALAQASESESGTVTLISPISRTFHGTIPGTLLPVWLTVVFEVDAGFGASLEAQGQITAGMSASEQILFGKQWNQNTGWTLIYQNPGPSFAFRQPAWQIQGSADLTVYLLPKVTLLAYSVAGVTADLKPYADLNYTFQLNPEECDLSLYAGLDSDLALDLTAWDSKWGQLPSATFHLIPQRLLWNTNCADMAPEIVSEPEVVTVVADSTAVFEVEAQGTEPMTYQWLRGGLPLTDDGRITGSASATLSIANAQVGDAGGYSVYVSNPYGSTNSSVALLNVNVVTNYMALIPAGLFTMGDTLDGESDAIPISVYVSAFYMDVNLVSVSQWQSIYSWAITNGYNFDGSASGKAANHPVAYVDWYDCAKWCNARSQQDGLEPVYYLDVGFTQVYTYNRQDVVYPSWSANGYRLPTEAEWEKAARGGLSGLRFPWGNSISESRANYYGDTGYSYDEGPNGYSTIWGVGAFPWTSPVGSFTPNGYGLYDMAGNENQWCWDWYGTPYAGGSDPHGPLYGSNRVLRSGDWLEKALFSRCASRINATSPSTSSFGEAGLGFRCVRGL